MPFILHTGLNVNVYEILFGWNRAGVLVVVSAKGIIRLVKINHNLIAFWNAQINKAPARVGSIAIR